LVEPTSNKTTDSSRKKTYSVVSALLGLVIGLSVFATGISYVLGGPYSHGPVTIFGLLLVSLGALIIVGSIPVFLRKATLLGALLILLPGIYIGPEGIIGVLPWSLTYLSIALGYALPIASFILALYSREKT